MDFTGQLKRLRTDAYAGPSSRWGSLFATLFTALFTALIILLVAGSVEAATFSVTTNGDLGDSVPGDGFCFTGFFPDGLAECTLRAAIQEANALNGADIIEFGESLPVVGGFVTFTPATVYQNILFPLTIDGYTAPGYALSDPWATPVIQISGSSVPFGSGLIVLGSASGSIIRGIATHGFPDDGLTITSPVASSSDITIEGCHLGVSNGVIHNGNGRAGLALSATFDATIGVACDASTCTGKGNLISGNDGDGIYIQGVGTGVRIAGNRIGTNLTGTTAFPRIGGPTANGEHGIQIDGAADDTVRIGDILPEGRNLISGNASGGIDAIGIGHIIFGNWIGTDASGNTAIPNGGAGIALAAPGSVIGGTKPGTGNVVSGNAGEGIEISQNLPALDITIQRNIVGLSADESAALGNEAVGIRLRGEGVTVRANTTGDNQAGISLSGSEHLIIANRVGLNTAGNPFPNSEFGIADASNDSMIGDLDAGNVIGFEEIGIIVGGLSSGTTIEANYIGTDELGANHGNGIGVQLLGDTITVGAVDGRANGLGNVIAFNTEQGVDISPLATSTRLRGNFIGTNTAGSNLGNGEEGVRTAGENTDVGSLASGSASLSEFLGNDIAFNGGTGISVTGGTLTARANRIYGNAGSVDIDLEADGVTANDFGDGDVGVNDRQNAPEFDLGLTQWNTDTGELEIVYRVTSNTSESAYPLTVDFYAATFNDGPDVYLGRDVYSAADALSFRGVGITPLDGLQPFGELVATATTDDGKTSELSPTPVPLPEPGAIAGIATGWVAVTILARRRTRATIP